MTNLSDYTKGEMAASALSLLRIEASDRVSLQKGIETAVAALSLDPQKKIMLYRRMEKMGFTLETRNLRSSNVPGINSPVVVDLCIDGKPWKSFVAKRYRLAERAARDRNISQSLADHGVRVLALQHSSCDGLINFSDFCDTTVVEEAIRKGGYCNKEEDSVLQELANLAVFGSGLKHSHPAGFSGDGGSSIEDLTSDTGNNYTSELTRRAARLGAGSFRFMPLFIERYASLLASGQSVLCANDAHVGNIFSDAVMFDFEASSYGALGMDLAKYLLSKRTHTLKHNGLNVDDIISDNHRAIKRFVTYFNSNIDIMARADPEMTESLCLRKVSEKQFRKDLRAMLLYDALTTTMCRLADYGSTKDGSYEDVAYANFSIFYSSLSTGERDSFDADFAHTSIGKFISRYSRATAETSVTLPKPRYLLANAA